MKPEQQFYQLLRPHLPGVAERIENAAGAGTPDFHCIYNGATYWVECKTPKTKSFNLYDLLEVSQRGWATRYLLNGGALFFIVRCNNEIHVYNNFTNRILLLPKPWDWSALKTEIVLQLISSSN